MEGLKKIEIDSKKIISTFDVDLEASRKLQAEVERKVVETI